ncbi:hypothetical protein QJS10_CPA06g02190 [Acorus calamus]|uniref:Uncharacterized protein n=1 Tax=Acorus calamus TaxID=4465 RepID=A0AAV9EI47_ACOCL|nr:hypothetical protein QJS10_CPA06g02190 [Acorus calamus]
MLHNALEGSGGNGASAAYSEAFRIIMRVGLGDKSFIALEDPMPSVRDAFAEALGAILALGINPGMQMQSRGKGNPHVARKLEGGLQKHLVLPFMKDGLVGEEFSLDDDASSFCEDLEDTEMVADSISLVGGRATPAWGISGNPIPQVVGDDEGPDIQGSPGYIMPNSVGFLLDQGGAKGQFKSFSKDAFDAMSLDEGSFLAAISSATAVVLPFALRHKYLLPDGDLSNYALQVMDMLQGNSFVDAHATACVLYILRVGVADQMAEIAQRNLLVLLAKQLESDDFLPPKGVAVLRLLSYLLTTLGEVRIEAALTLRGLAEVDPTCVGGLISFGVTTLLALRETLSVEKVSRLRVELDSFHGQAIVLAALISISPRLTLGYPARLPKSVLDLSKKIITEYSRNAMAATMQKEAGWVLLASLISSMPKEPETISKALLNQMLMFFGIMFAAQDGSGKLTLLTMVDQCLKAGKKQSWHVASVTNVCVGLLSGLKASLALRQMLHVDVLSSMQTIFQIRSLLGELATATDSSYIGSIAFSLGCIHQSAGGIALSTFVPATVNSVSLLAKGSNTGLQSWSLHALRLTIEAAGLSYVSQVQATLSLAMEVLLSDENGWVELRQGVGRLVNAIIAVLGPELAPGSTFFSRCKSVVAEISSGQETSTLIEYGHFKFICVRFTQQLVLFAPQAVSTHSHVQTLLPTLSSKQPSLRHLAVSTLHHLIEKDPISTGQFEGMQPIGVGLLITIMDKFGKVGDPDLPGHLLLEQYQAQLVSAVRTALSSSSGPLLLEAGLQLATKILTSSILSGDQVALQRLFTWISRPLNEFKDLYYPSFAEWVACKYKPFLDGIQSLLVSSKVRPCLDEAWPVILQAIALDAAPIKSDTDVSSKVGIEDYSANDFISEPYLLPLESCEMALLVLQSLLTGNFFSLQFITLDLCEELLQVLIYSEYMTASWNSFVVHLLLKIVQFCPDNFLEVENFTCSAIELGAKYLCKTFHSSDALLQTHPVCDDLLSALLTLTEKILFRVNHEMQDRLFLAIISTGCGCFRAALTDLCLLISQKSECEKGFTSLLLETIFMIVSAPAEGLSKELNEIKGTAMALVSQLAQLPSAAAQVRDILLAMPVTFRLQLQDIIRVSVSQSQASVETKPNISIPATKLAVQLKPSSEPRTHTSQSAPLQPNTDGFDEDDWDAFQSLPASVAVPPQATLAAANGSSVSDVEEDDFHDFSNLDEKEAKGREFEGQDLHEVYDSLPFEDAKDELDDDHHVENKQCDFVQDSSTQPLGNANVTNDAIHEEAMRDGEGPNYHISSDSSPVMDPKEELSSGHDVEMTEGHIHPG